MADEFLVAWIFRVDGYSCIAKQGFWASSGDYYLFELVSRMNERIGNTPEFTLLFFVGNFDVRESCLVLGAVVDKLFTPVD